jgi:hypothetical protein
MSDECEWIPTETIHKQQLKEIAAKIPPLAILDSSIQRQLYTHDNSRPKQSISENRGV